MFASRFRPLFVAALLVAAPWMVLARDGRVPQQVADAKAQATNQKAAADFFEKEVLPILKANCHNCHGGDKIRGGLVLVNRSGLLKGGESGPVINLQKPTESLLLKAINHDGELKMPAPPAAKLAAKDIEILTRWVKAGLPGIDDKIVAAAPKKGPHVTEESRKYWAYQPVKRLPAPVVKNAAWVRNPVDAFILSGLEAKGLTPAPAADRHALARRVYYDITGLPPTPDEIDAFVNDPAPDAYEKLIDKLLDSPHYGEKWARHWLDLVRFAETNGFEFDQNKPFVWRYRDYVIDAFNKDMPYDQFVREQIAGDLLPNPTANMLIATGYYRLNQWDTGAADRTLQKYEALDSMVSTTAQVFLGMSVGCARCHDHKADPITHADYYRLMAFFHNLTDLGASKTKRVMAPIEGKYQEKLLKERQNNELNLARQIAKLEQKFVTTLAAKKGVKASDMTPSDMIELTYRFYRDTWEKLPDWEGYLVETQGPVGHNFFTLAPASRDEAIGLVFDGKLKVLQEGEYTFYLECTAGARLTIDGNVVLDEPTKGKHNTSVKAKLRAGILPVKLEYFNATDAPILKVEWSGPGVSRRLLSSDKTQNRVDLADAIKKAGKLLNDKEVQQHAGLVKEFEQSRRTPPTQVGLDISCVTEAGAAPTYIFLRGNPQAKSDRVDPGFPEVLLPGKPLAVKGGRLALANWLTDPANPLPARVMVNRLWQHHFGRGIVPSPNDFGKQGEQPTHPVLLDWLASEFSARGYSIKEMHRLLLTSSTYRMSSKGNEKALAVDPSNMLFWRFNLRRLSAEEVRDSILAVSGKLNLKMGGPSVLPPIPKEVLAGQARPGQGWKPSSPEEASRRSVYVFTKRSLLVPILAQFDLADTDASCPVRFTTTLPTQALGLLNDQFSNEHAKVFAQRLSKERPGDVEKQVTRAIRLTTGRVPGKQEIAKDVAFIQDLQRHNNLSEAEAMRFYCLMALNTNEFVYLD